MRKFLVLAALIGLFGSAALACDVQTGGCLSPGQSATATQSITVNVPAVLRLVIDTPGSQNWTVDLNGLNGSTVPSTAPSGCYVIPYSVGGSGESISQFLSDAGAQSGDLSGLYPWSPSMGYPPVIKNSKGTVLTWSQVTSLTAYNENGNASAMAKGNLLCTHQFLAEKYTNCQGAVFYVNLSAASGFGDMYIDDNAETVGGSSIGSTGYFQLPANGKNYLLVSGGTDASTGNYIGLPPGQWINDNITQYLWLGPSAPGNYSLTATYTLGSAFNNNGDAITFQN